MRPRNASMSRAVRSTIEKFATAEHRGHALDERGGGHVVFKREQQTRRQAANFFRAQILDRGEQISLEQLGEIGAVAFLEGDFVVTNEHRIHGFTDNRFILLLHVTTPMVVSRS